MLRWGGGGTDTTMEMELVYGEEIVNKTAILLYLFFSSFGFDYSNLLLIRNVLQTSDQAIAWYNSHPVVKLKRFLFAIEHGSCARPTGPRNLLYAATTVFPT